MLLKLQLLLLLWQLLPFRPELLAVTVGSLAQQLERSRQRAQVGLRHELTQLGFSLLRMAIETKIQTFLRHQHVVDHMFELRHNHVFQSNFFLPSYYGRLAHPLRIAEAPAFDSE